MRQLFCLAIIGLLSACATQQHRIETVTPEVSVHLVQHTIFDNPIEAEHADTGQHFYLDKKPILTLEDFTESYLETDPEKDHKTLTLVLSEAAANKLSDSVKHSSGKHFAVLLEDDVITDFVIKEGAQLPVVFQVRR